MITFSKKKQKQIAMQSESENIVNTKNIIKQIHNTFYTEVDRLLELANNFNDISTNKQELIDKGLKLKKLGFVNSKEAKEATIEIDRLNSLEKENDEKKHLTRAINYFSIKYPTYKFITRKSIEKICEEYGLLYGTINDYIGEVPDINLKHIEEFKISAEDKLYFENYSTGRLMYDYESFCLAKENTCNDHNFEHSTTIGECPLEIVASKKDFDTRNMRIVNYKITENIPDPIVLCPVAFENHRYFLIVTAWGDEASDKLVVNQQMN